MHVRLDEKLRGAEPAAVLGGALAPALVPSSDPLLDRILWMLENARPVEACLDLLVGGLGMLRSVLPSDAWRRFCTDCLTHPLADLVHQDPLTGHAFAGGYPGDRMFVDLVCSEPAATGALRRTSDCGRALYARTRALPTPAALRERREVIARLVDVAAERPAGATAAVLAIGCGHLWEAGHSHAMRERRIGRWLALDPDPAAVTRLRATAVAPCIEVREGSVADVLVGGGALGCFDVVYAAELCDQLPTTVVRTLVAAAFGRLAPGGTLLLSNLAPCLPDLGYVESFMGWRPVLRSVSELAELLRVAVPADEVAGGRVFAGAEGGVVYGTLTRA
jgi:hypothetical protein